RRHPAHHRVAGRAPAGGQRRGPPRRAAALPVPVLSGVSRRLAQLAKISVTELKGVGEKKADALAQMEIATVLDLLTHYPRRYLDRTQQATIRELKVGDEAMVLAIVKRVQSRRTRNRRALVEIDVFDGTSYLKCTFFNQPWR